MKTIFAFDTATTTATCCGLVRDGELLGERVAEARSVLAAADELTARGRARARARSTALVVGTGPGQLHLDPDRPRDRARPRARARHPRGRRLDAARLRGRAARDRRAPRRGVHRPARSLARPEELDVAGERLVGDGAVRYRELFEAAGAEIPPDDDPAHLPAARPPRRARRRASARPRRRAALPPRSRREAAPMTAVAIEIRALAPLRPRARSRRSSSAPTARRGRARCSRPSSRRRPRSASARSRATQLVGYVVNSRYVDAWHVMNVAVDPDHQRRGIATRLLERLFELTRDDQRRGYTLEVRVSNTVAIELYEKLGFERQGIRRGYYTDNREDALIMWRDPDAGKADSARPALRRHAGAQGSTGARRDPRHRDLVRRDGGRRRHRRRRDPRRTS